MLAVDMKLYWFNNTHYQSKMTMAHSIESRVPFTDYIKVFDVARNYQKL